MNDFGFPALPPRHSFVTNTSPSLQPSLSASLSAGAPWRYRPADETGPHTPMRRAGILRSRRYTRVSLNNAGAAIGANPPPATARPQVVQPLAEPNVAQRADTALANAYAKVFNCTRIETQDILRQTDRTLYASWRNLRAINEVQWTRSASEDPPGAHDLAYAATLLRWLLQRHSEMDDASLLDTAQSYLTPPIVMPAGEALLEDIYRDVLQRESHWISTDKVRTRHLSATQILQVVWRHRLEHAGTRFTLDDRLQHPRDVIVDEAALIAYRAQADRSDNSDTTAMTRIRGQYLIALIDEWEDAALGVRLLPSTPIAPVNAKFWYDGSVLQNARGMQLEQIVDALYDGAPYVAEGPKMQKMIDQASRGRRLPGQPAIPVSHSRRPLLMEWMHVDPPGAPRYRQREGTRNFGDAWLTRGELRAVVEKAMHDLALDTVYPGGTALHAVATIVRRLGPLHDIDFEQFDSPTELMQVFNRLNQIWQHHPRYPVQPTLSAAHYLAQGSGVVFLDARCPLTPVEQIEIRIAAPLLQALNKSHDSVRESIAALQRKTIDVFRARSRTQIDDYQKFIRTGEFSIYVNALKQIDKSINAPEKISYLDTPDLLRQLGSYFRERLLAQGPLPNYDRDFLIRQILRQKLAMTDADLEKTNTFTIQFDAITGHNIRLSKMPVEEFKTRSRSGDAQMRYNGKVIRATSELQAANAQIAETLFDHPLIRAKSKEIVRQKASAYNKEDIDKVRGVLVKDILGLPQEETIDRIVAFCERMFGSPTVRTVVEAFASGDPKQILGLLPFVIPLYEIEEGIRLSDKQRALDGALHFGEDAIFTLLGAGVEGSLRRQVARDAEAMLLARTRMSAPERAGVDMLQNMAALMPEVASERLAQRRVVVENDIFKVGAGSDAQSAPTEMRTPDNSVQRMIYLNDERRISPVAPSGAGYVETDLRGRPAPGAPPIFRDAESGLHYRLIRNPDPHSGAAGISTTELSARSTISHVRQYWQSVVDIPGIRVRSTAPEDILDTLFRVSSHPLFAKFREFWLATYERSDTAVAIINSAYDRMKYGGRRCEIVFDADDAQMKGNKIWFLNDKGLGQYKYISSHGSEHFQRIRMWLHESLHWLTKTQDYSAFYEAFRNRGATIYLEDRILSELGEYPPLPPRVIYKSLETPVRPALDEGLPTPRNLRRIHEWTIAENVYLDKLVDQGRSFPPTLRVLGEPVSERGTVRQILSLKRRLDSFGPLGAGNALHLFESIADMFASSPSYLRHRPMLRTLVTRSKTFRALAAAWSTRLRPYTVDIALKNFDLTPLDFSHNSLAHHVSSDGSKIWFNAKAFHYFSEFDLTPVDPIRRYAGAIIDLFLKEMAPGAHEVCPPDAIFDRGIHVLLENQVLQEIGEPSPKRICAALTTDRNAFLPDQTAITRAAADEDGYLREHASWP
ncbi:MAG: hypothetical protein JWP38_1749 [Herbaspirillum sp.]|nr:hypothetical protein [Herbaspirillum sp.]